VNFPLAEYKPYGGPIVPIPRETFVEMKRLEQEKLRKRAVQQMLKAWVAPPKAETPSRIFEHGERQRNQLDKEIA
jgi:hypothetical protein